MKRVIIRDLSNNITHKSEMLDPTVWIESGISQNWWGLSERKRWKDELSEYELTLVISEETLEISPEIPGDPNAEPPTETVPAVTRVLVTLKAMYTIEIVDIQSEIDAENQKRTQLVNLRNRIRALGDLGDLTAAELKEAIMKLMKLLILANRLD
jgi:hypothetical protein